MGRRENYLVAQSTQFCNYRDISKDSASNEIFQSHHPKQRQSWPQRNKAGGVGQDGKGRPWAHQPSLRFDEHENCFMLVTEEAENKLQLFFKCLL